MFSKINFRSNSVPDIGKSGAIILLILFDIIGLYLFNAPLVPPEDFHKSDRLK
jgi:hypothetical protein